MMILLTNNLRKFNVGNLSIYYSYETPIGFRYKGNLVLSENIWSPSTGKHLNFIDPDKAYRIDNASMMQELELIMQKIGA